MNYILVFPEALYMPNLDHSLFNPNQLRHFGTIIQDNPYDTEPMCIRSANNTFTRVGRDRHLLEDMGTIGCGPQDVPTCGVEFEHAMVPKTSAISRDLTSRTRGDRI
jgi:hypothetical protein